MPRPLEPDNWAQLEPLVDALLDAAPEDRAALLAEFSDGDAARRAELEGLVAECERGHPLLDRSAAERFIALFSEDVQVPESLARRYPVSRELGRGGMARVFLAHDVKHGRDVAVKIIRPELAATLGRERFLKEIAISAQLHHPHIVPLYDSGEADGVLYYVMPYESGHSLRDRIERDGPLTVQDALTVLRDICDALAHAHQRGIVHRDIKPENVLVTGRHARVADFGIAKAMTESTRDAPTLTTLGLILGTPAYMAPEQITADAPVDHRVDIYAVGVLAFELLTGQVPFKGELDEVLSMHLSLPPRNLAELRPDVPRALSDCIMKCLEKRRVDRWQSAEELLGILERAEVSAANVDHVSMPADGAIAAPDESLRAERARSPWMQRRAAVGAVLVAGALVLSTVWHADSRTAVAPPAANNEAYTLYLKGRYFWNKRTERDMQLAVNYFQQATDLNPGYSLAWVGLADAWIFRGWYSLLAPRETFPKAKDAILKALEFDSTLSEAHASLAHIHLEFDHDWAAAEREYRRGIELDPANAVAHHWYGGFLSAMGRHDEAMRQALTARSLDPLSSIIQTWVGLRHYFARQHESAVAEFRKALELNRSFAPAYWHLGMAYEQLRRHAEAIEAAKQAVALDPGSLIYLASLGHAYAKAGQVRDARETLDRLAGASRTRHVSAYHVAVIHIALGDTTTGLDWLERALAEQSPWIGYLNVDPRVDPVREQSRFRALIRRTGLPS